MSSGAPALLWSVVLVVALLGSGAAAAGVAAQETGSSSCTEVAHDAFRYTNSTISEVQDTGGSSATVSNVPVTVEETDQFIRVRVSNPNGYCVRLRLQISEQIVTPAELGTVEATQPESSEIEAQWSAKHSLKEEELYTEITVELPPGADGVLFAPSKVRVKTLSWTGEAKGEAGSWREKVSGILGEKPELEENQYHLKGQKGQVITVDLQSDDGREVEEWQATYTDANGVERPVGQESDAPVFYSADGESVRFHYNRESNVSFTANPGFTDKAGYEIASYRASIQDLTSIKLPFLTVGGAAL